MPSVISYEGSKYRTEFWEGQGREYEDQIERVALHRLLPPTGKRLLEIGAGFGRLTREFDGYEQVVLLDYSRSLLAEAQAYLGKDPRFVYVAADIYRSPIADGSCDAATMIRVIHHMSDVPAALAQIRATLVPNGTFILEFANKRNLKAVLRYWLGRQEWTPFSLEPYEFVELNFDFHPRYMLDALKNANFQTKRRLALSYLRIGILKRLLPTYLLVGLDSLLQQTGILYSPSVFTQNIALGNAPINLTEALFKCPQCNSSHLAEQPDCLVCEACGAKWSTQEGIYDFRECL